MSISNTVKTIQDIMRKDVGVDGDAQRIGQLVWMIFLKIFEDKEQEAELLNDGYKSPLPDELRWCNWAADDEGMTGDELLDFVNNKLFKQLKELHVGSNGNQRVFIVRSVFEDGYNYMKSGTLMRQVVNKINEIDFNISDDRHMFGDIYEKILSDLQSAGNAGEYYTPRAVTQFMADMVDPKLGEKVLDPACGTGGFLTCSINNIREKYVKTVDDEIILQKSIFGVEKKQLPHSLCMTNMLLHNIDVPSNIKHDNTLARPLKSYGSKDRVDVVITNPPFGGMEEDGIESNFPTGLRTRETADLFLLLIMHLLKDGGRAGIVLPDGTLFGEGVKTRIKEKLLKECNLHTIVRLPNGVFSPYTGIKTNLLFFTKGEKTKDVWFYEHPYPEGYKSYSKTKPLRIEEFEHEKKWWENRKENEFAWKVSVKDIKASGYNLDIKNPHSPEDDLGNPDELLAKYKGLLKEVANTRDKLKQELMKALGGQCLMKLDTFFDNFELLSDAPNGVQKLREMILQLAVQGKLVPQDPKDEPASVLLEKIKAEKERRIKEGKIKKTKPLPPIISGEIPYELPKTWEWVRLRTICYDLGQKKPDTEFTYIDVTSINKEKGVISNEVKLLDANNAPSRARKIVKKGSVIYSTVRPYLLNIAIVDKNFKPEPIVSTAFAVIHPHVGMYNRFIYYYLRSRPFIEYVENAMTGMAYPAINDGKMNMGLIPAPPTNEQKRIVAKVAELMALCDELEARLSQSQTDCDRLMEAAVAEIMAA